ncbi:hypothetical protein IG631_06023 [Alternaria alternata]|nr:hypothetical protein IG631_06023 [Alternaria alternata]
MVSTALFDNGGSHWTHEDTWLATRSMRQESSSTSTCRHNCWHNLTPYYSSSCVSFARPAGFRRCVQQVPCHRLHKLAEHERRTSSLTWPTVCPTRHLSLQHGLFRLDNRASCVAKAPGWPCDCYAKEGCR